MEIIIKPVVFIVKCPFEDFGKILINYYYSGRKMSEKLFKIVLKYYRYLGK